MTYSVKEAKDNLSEIIRLAESGQPQIIRRHDTEVAVVVSINEWKRSKGKRQTLVEVLRNSPLVGLDLDFSRQDDLPREIDLGG
ncbi:MAG: type II toxin-antitoxin system Phd/YefM family antitoxin [Pyrinomonadaceae bacterium]